MKAKENAGETILKILSNPLVLYALGGIGIFIIARYLIPNLFNAGKTAFNSQVDETLGALSTIVGAPSSQEPEKRTTFDSIRGLVTQGDRALSDLIG